MSMDTCDNYERLVDTDEDLDCYVPVEDGTRLTPDRCICEFCREELGIEPSE